MQDFSSPPSSDVLLTVNEQSGRTTPWLISSDELEFYSHFNQTFTRVHSSIRSLSPHFFFDAYSLFLDCSCWERERSERHWGEMGEMEDEWSWEVWREKEEGRIRVGACGGWCQRNAWASPLTSWSREDRRPPRFLTNTQTLLLVSSLAFCLDPSDATNRIRKDLNKNTRSITIKALWNVFFSGLIFISALGSVQLGSARLGPPCQHPVLQLQPGCRDYRDGDGGKESKNRGERKWAW